MRNTSGRKFVWTVGTNRWVELPAMPAQFNGYTLLSEFYAPDGLSYAGLMSKDGGQTHEVWASDYDYANMRQITPAGLKLNAPQWLATSKLLRIDFEADSTRGIINHCNAAVVNPDAVNQLSAQQLVAAPLPE